MRQRLRDQTVGRLRRSRLLRAGRLAAALALCYAAGAGTVWLVRPTAAVSSSEAVRPQPEPPVVAPEQSPQQLELAAEQVEGADSAKLYLAAARKFARDFGDWNAALRCYRNALDAAPEIKATIDPQSDDWLMTTLKLSRREETAHANEND